MTAFPRRPAGWSPAGRAGSPRGAAGGRRRADVGLAGHRDDLAVLRVPLAIARVDVDAELLRLVSEGLLQQRVALGLEDLTLQLLRDLLQRDGPARNDVDDVPAELRVHLDERARLGGEDGVAELLDELPPAGKAEVATGVLVAGVLRVLRGELREAAGVGL